jgi:hypothetical protein
MVFAFVGRQESRIRIAALRRRRGRGGGQLDRIKAIFIAIVEYY